MTDRTCSIEGCDKPRLTRGWCKAHYQRWLRTGSTGSKPVGLVVDTCTIDGCDRPHHSRGWCKPHYKRWGRTGSTRSDPVYRPDALADFHRLMNRITDDCVVWPNAVTVKGYGMLNTPDGRTVRTHREALRIITGGEPKGMLAIHGPCHNPACMNVLGGHVTWGTPEQNMADKKRDGTECPPRRRSAT
jgi:hypothetical protein